MISGIYGWIPFIDNMHFLDRTFLLFITCIIINVGTSLATAPPDPEQVAQYTWSKSMFKEETEELKDSPWYLNYRILAILLLIVTAIIVGMFS